MGPSNNKIVFPLATDPSKKIGKAPSFIQIGYFLREKWWKMLSKFCTFWVLFFWRNHMLTDWFNFHEILLDANSTIFCFGLVCQVEVGFGFKHIEDSKLNFRIWKIFYSDSKSLKGFTLISSEIYCSIVKNLSWMQLWSHFNILLTFWI